MAIFDRVPPHDLGTTYTHYGWFMGLVPVYVSEPNSDAPLLVERNWVPGWSLALVEALFAAFCWVATTVDPQYEPLYAIRITGKIER